MMTLRYRARIRAAVLMCAGFQALAQGAGGMRAL